MESKQILYAGIDGGGTKCSAVLFDQQGKVLGKGRAGAANASRDLTGSQDAMIAAVKLALKDANLTNQSLADVHVGAGLAGACVPDVKAKLLAWAHPFAQFAVDSDLTAACAAAHAGQDGALLIIGTGSAAAKMINGQLTQLGGHGFLLGDKGSGAWFGRQAVSSTLEALDGIIQMGALHQAVLKQLNVQNSTDLVQLMINASPSEFAQLAPLIIQLGNQNEAVSVELIAKGVTYLDRLCQQTLLNTKLSIVLVGGLAPSLVPWFSEAVRERMGKAKAGPEWGAACLVNPDLPLVT